MGKYITQLDLDAVASADTLAQLFTDPANPGVVDTEAIAEIIELAEGEVDSFLIGVRSIAYADLTPYDRLLKRAALDYAMAFAFERHPEYERTFGEYPRGRELYKRAENRMERIQAAIQSLPDQTSKQGNVGGVVRSAGPRFMIDSIDGTENGAGF